MVAGCVAVSVGGGVGACGINLMGRRSMHLSCMPVQVQVHATHFVNLVADLWLSRSLTCSRVSCRRAFEKHFKEWRHQNGMRALGIPNNKMFYEVTKIDEAVELWKSIQVSPRGHEPSPTVLLLTRCTTAPCALALPLCTCVQVI